MNKKREKYRNGSTKSNENDSSENIFALVKGHEDNSNSFSYGEATQLVKRNIDMDIAASFSDHTAICHL